MNMSDTKEQQMHQIMVQRRNLARVCRFAVKGLIDKSCFDTIGERSPEIVNFCNILEHVLTHRIKSHNSWYSQDDRSFWNYIKVACLSVPHNCIKSIKTMEHITTPTGKGRAWLKVVLMEKRLSEYISAALKQTKLTKAAYNEGALMLSEEAQLLVGSLLGLNAIDFSFDLKGENVDYGNIPLVIDYTPFLRFQQCPESVHSDAKELLELSNSNSSSSILSEDIVIDDGALKTRYAKMEARYKAVCEQKGYLEELVRLRESQLEGAHVQRKKLVETLHNLETENKRDRQQLESVIIELQAQLVTSKQDNQRLSQHIKEYARTNQTMPVINEPSMEAIGYHELPRSPLRARAHVEPDRHSNLSTELSTAHAMADNRSLLSDSRSLLSELSAAGLPEDSSSMIPMAGSFASLVSTHSNETSKSNEATKFKIDFVRNNPMVSAVDTKLLSPVAMAVLESNAFDNEDDGVIYYSSHNENKVCVTAEVHRADSLLSPVLSPAEENYDLPKGPQNGTEVKKSDSKLGAPENSEKDTSINPVDSGQVGNLGVLDIGGDADNRMIRPENLGIVETQASKCESDGGSSLMTPTDLPSSGQFSSSQPDISPLKESAAGVPSFEQFDKNAAEETLADQETLDFQESRTNNDAKVNNLLSGEVLKSVAEEEHDGSVNVESHNGEENFDDVQDDYHWD